ncbi:MAG: SpoIIE family protein phosphatase [Selenomonadaceae bacterium]|nr:SpoIIE family protein phosphatase [Selenomonadaceae bacterium]
MKEKFKQIGRMGIKKQVQYLVLACCIVSLLVAGLISLVAMYNVRKDSVQIGVDIGNFAAESSSQALKTKTLNGLLSLANERADQIETIFRDFERDVRSLSQEMTAILQNPSEYSLRRVNPPNALNAGRIVPQLQYRADVNPANLSTEVGLTANLQDFQMRIMENNPSVGAIYVSSVNGFNITVDDVSERRVDSNNVPMFNDYRERPWYKMAMEKQDVAFSNIFVDSHGRGLAISCAMPYYGYNGEIAGIIGEGRILTDINKIVTKTDVGETGYCFLINQNGRIVFSPKTEGGGSLSINNVDDINDAPSLLYSKEPTISAVAKEMVDGQEGIAQVNIDGKPCYLAYTPIENRPGWSFGVVIEESEITIPADTTRHMIEDSTREFVKTLNGSITMMVSLMLIAFVIVILIAPYIGRKISETLTKPIMILSDGVREIASGNLDKRLEIHTGNEIEHLAETFNGMTMELKNYMANLTKVTADKERIATELNVATNIQLSMLPRDFNIGKGFEIYARMNAAKEVGGDFYDFYMLDENHLMITIADVSGKGVPAALFMVISKTVLKNFALSMKSPDDLSAVMTLANQQLCDGNDEMMFVTVFMGMLDLKTGKFIYVNGGHNPPMLYRKSEDRFEFLNVEQNVVLGMMDGMDFEQQEVDLKSGDILYLYTDGVTEAMDISNNQYGEDRLSKTINSLDKTTDLKTLLKAVRADISDHVGEAAQSDDITMLAVRFRN